MEGVKKTHASPPMGKYKWTTEQEQYLEEKWGTISVPAIAKRLNRTPNAVIVRARRLGLGPALANGEYISFHQLVLAIGYSGSSDSYKVTSWIKNRGFPIHTKR